MMYHIDRIFISSNIGEQHIYTMLSIYINMYEYIHTDVNINRDLTSHNTHMYIYIEQV